jgi:hypothetical protein
MIRSPVRLLVLLAPLALSTLALAQSPEPGYIPLFDGKDLTGWRYGKEVLQGQTETPDKRFYVSGGVLVMAAKDKDGGKAQKELIAVREFSKDFILKLEFKAAQEAACAIIVRNQAFPCSDFVRRGDEKRLKKFRNDDWNEIEIVVKMAVHAENKRLTESDTLDADFQNGKAIAKLNGRTIDPNRIVMQIEGYGRVNGEGYVGHVGMNTKGQVGLRTGSGKIEFRNIRYKELQ